jgi:hypothetical protein
MADKASAPVSKITIYPIEAAIWRNESSKGPWFSVTIERKYKDGDKYKQSDRFGKDHLLTAAKVLDLAHTELVNLERDEHAARSNSAAPATRDEDDGIAF